MIVSARHRPPRLSVIAATRQTAALGGDRRHEHLEVVSRTFKTEEAISYQELDSIDNPDLYGEDDVVEIFIRANSGGTRLGKSDLLFSLLSSSWDEADDRMEGLLEDLNRHGFAFNRDFVLKTCLTLVDQGARYEVEKFRKAHVRDEIEKNWDAISDAMRDVLDFVRGKTFKASSHTRRSGPPAGESINPRAVAARLLFPAAPRLSGGRVARREPLLEAPRDSAEQAGGWRAPRARPLDHQRQHDPIGEELEVARSDDLLAPVQTDVEQHFWLELAIDRIHTSDQPTKTVESLDREVDVRGLAAVSAARTLGDDVSLRTHHAHERGDVRVELAVDVVGRSSGVASRGTLHHVSRDELDRPRLARLALDQPLVGQGYHHAMDGGGRDREVRLQIGFGRRPPMTSMYLPMNASTRAASVSPRWCSSRASSAIDRDHQAQ